MLTEKGSNHVYNNDGEARCAGCMHACMHACNNASPCLQYNHGSRWSSVIVMHGKSEKCSGSQKHVSDKHAGLVGPYCWIHAPCTPCKCWNCRLVLAHAMVLLWRYETVGYTLTVMYKAFRCQRLTHAVICGLFQGWGPV